MYSVTYLYQLLILRHRYAFFQNQSIQMLTTLSRVAHLLSIFNKLVVLIEYFIRRKPIMLCSSFYYPPADSYSPTELMNSL